MDDYISWEHAFQSLDQFGVMQAYIEYCKDYYVGKRITNDMCGINHKSKFLLDHPNDTNYLKPNAPYYNNDEYFGDDLNENHELTLKMTWKTLTFHNIYVVTSMPYFI